MYPALWSLISTGNSVRGPSTGSILVVDIGGSSIPSPSISRVGDPRELDQRGHIGLAAGQPGDLDPEDRTSPWTHQGDQVP